MMLGIFLKKNSGDTCMGKPKAVTRAEYDGLQFIRWVLFLITAAEAAGIEELTRHRLHALLFMSFASSRYYGIRPLRQRAQRTSHGPYYRAAHIALGQLTLAGLTCVRDFAAHPSAGDLQFEGQFSLTPDGLSVVSHLRETEKGAEIYRYLLDLCLGTVIAIPESERGALVSNEPLLDRMLERDLTYEQAMGRNTRTLPVEDGPGDVSPTVKGLRSLDQYLKNRMPVNNKDVLSAYQRILKSRLPPPKKVA
jgi:hypothetical protein